jgi:hypothetical protein
MGANAVVLEPLLDTGAGELFEFRYRGRGLGGLRCRLDLRHVLEIAAVVQLPKPADCDLLGVEYLLAVPAPTLDIERLDDDKLPVAVELGAHVAPTIEAGVL